MRIVVLAGQELHHKNLCAKIAALHNVVAVIHPVAGTIGGRFQRVASVARSHGSMYSLLRAGAMLPKALSGWNVALENSRGESNFFPDAQRAFDRIESHRVHVDIDVNADEGIRLIQSLEPDIVLNLGGAIYREKLIKSCKLFLNYHSGISPIYNGAGTVNFAFANGHIHLCGGTLMKMSPNIDGGRILAHFLPSIEPNDTPTTLLMKTYAGAVVLYDRFVSDVSLDVGFSGALQRRTLFYVRGKDWTLYQSLRTRQYLRRSLAEKHLRDQRIIEYWRQSNDNEAEEHLNETLANLLWGAV